SGGAPRTAWSDLRGSTPRFTATSIDSLNLVLATSFSSVTASSTEYCFSRSIFAAIACLRFDNCGMSQPLTADACAARAAGDRAYGCFESRGRQIRHFQLGDFLDL